MAQTNKADAGLTTELGIAHDHDDGDKNHMHRLGDLPHLHGEDGKAVLLDEHGRPLFTDDPDAPRDPRTAEDGAEWPEELQAEATEMAQRRPDAIASNGQPRPVAVSGAPGSRLSDVASRAIALTMEGYPAEVHDEVIWTEIATHALVSMREEQANTKQPADLALVSAALDAVDHIARVRGLLKVVP